MYGRVAMTLLTLASLLWHALAGCCAHHAHANTVGHSHAASSETSLHHGSSEYADAVGGKHDKPGSRESSPESPHECDKCHCVFLAPKPTTVTPAEGSSVVHFSLVELAQGTEACHLPPHDRTLLAESYPRFGDPRRYLALSVLLL